MRLLLHFFSWNTLSKSNMSVFGGIVQKTGSGGSSGQWNKSGIDQIKAACVGAGGSGFRDDDGDKDGGGGGGAGRAVGLQNISTGSNILWRQGDKSPRRTSGKGGNDGTDSYVRKNNGQNIALGEGGNTGTDNSGGGAGGLGTGNSGQASGSAGSDDDDGRDGGAAAGCSKCGNDKAGQGMTVSWSGDNPNFGCTGCPGGIDAPAFGGGGAGNNDDGDSGSGGQGYVGWAWYWADPVINSITVTNQYNLNPTTSGGIQNAPSDVVNIAWSTTNAQSVQVRRAGSTICNDSNGGSGNCNISTGLQSTNSNTPASKFYNVVAYGYGGNFVSQQVFVYVKNDWTPQTSNSYITKTFINQPSQETVKINIGNVSGVDMPVWGYVNSSGCALGTNTFSSSNPKKFNNGDPIILTIPTPYYEVDITGRTSSTTGNIASKTVTIYLGSQNFNVTVQVARPVIDENFDFGNVEGKYPYQDIDLIENTPQSHMITNLVTADDIEISRSKINSDLGSGEISTEIKSSDPNIQIQINNGTWQYVRQK